MFVEISKLPKEKCITNIRLIEMKSIPKHLRNLIFFINFIILSWFRNKIKLKYYYSAIMAEIIITVIIKY